MQAEIVTVLSFEITPLLDKDIFNLVMQIFYPPGCFKVKNFHSIKVSFSWKDSEFDDKLNISELIIGYW